MLGQIDSPDATRALALLAVHAKGAETRRIAAETLIRRDPREFVGLLISLVQETTTYQVNAESSQNTSGELVVDGPSATLHRFYRPTPLPQIPLLPGDSLQYDQYGLPVISRYAGFSQRSIPLASGYFSTVKGFLQSEGQVRQQAEASIFASNPSLMNTSAGAAVAQAGLAMADRQSGDVVSNALAQIKSRGGVAAVGNRTIDWSTSATIQTQYRELIPIGQMVVAARMANEQLHAKMAADAMQIDMTNASIAQANGRVLPILQATTGQDFGSDQKAWSRWWTDNLGYSQSQSPTKPEYYDMVQASAPAISPTLTSSTSSFNSSTVRIGHSCFARGTLVRTLTGTKAIETLQIGDVVLSDDLTLGTLSYQPIVAIHHNPPAATFKVDLGSETIVATGIHRLWKAGKGWVMTRDLKPGDILRTVGGTAVVKGVTPGESPAGLQPGSGRRARLLRRRLRRARPRQQPDPPRLRPLRRPGRIGRVDKEMSRL